MKPDLEAIRKAAAFWDDCSEVVMTQAEIDVKRLLAYVDELREAAGKVTCRSCDNTGIDLGWPHHNAPCGACTDLRRLLGENHE